jgi:hypothetical protein
MGNRKSWPMTEKECHLEVVARHAAADRCGVGIVEGTQ